MGFFDLFKKKNAPAQTQGEPVSAQGEIISPRELLIHEMAEFMISHIEEKFKDKLIQKMFFEFGNYYSSEHNNEPYCDFRAVVASKDEVERVVEKYVQQGETREDAVAISDSSGEYDTHDWQNHVFFQFPEAKYGIEWGDMVECAEEAARRIKMHDFSFPKTPDFTINDEVYLYN